MEEQKFGVGIQNFEKLRRMNRVYVDKTQYIYNLVNDTQYAFLSRPRRFGKSLLISTIEALFEGKRELFEGLKISDTDWEWQQYPVIHIDLSASEYLDLENFDKTLSHKLSTYETIYGVTDLENLIENRFKNLLKAAYDKTGRQVVILIDEYDYPLIKTIGKPNLHSKFKSRLQAFYTVLKSYDRYIRFAMLTGITKFSKVSVFSGLNNLQDISLLAEYNAICGISESEIDHYLLPGIKTMANKRGLLLEDLRKTLKERYDGYHFSDQIEDLYNPFSLLSTLDNKKLGSYWFESGSPSFLMELLQDRDFKLSSLEDERRSETQLNGADLYLVDPVPLFYQTGYLTIKGYDFSTDTYRLGYPNREVKEAFLEFLLPHYANSRTQTGGLIPRLLDAVNTGDAEKFMSILSSFFADFPYPQIRERELHYQNVSYIIMKLMGYNVKTEYQTSQGRIDMVIKTAAYIYIIEFKLDGTPQEALEQIERKQYCKPFLGYGLPIIQIGASFSSMSRDLDSWMIRTINFS